MKTRIVLAIVMVLALTLPLVGTAAAQGPDWTSGQDATATIKGVLKYRHLFNPGKSGYEGFLGPCDGGYECNVGQATWDTNPAKYAETNKVTLVYDGSKFTATIDPDGPNGPYVMETTGTFPPAGTLNYMQLTLRGQVGSNGNNEIVSFKNAKLNGNSLSDVTSITDWTHWNITGVDLTGGFTLEGDMELTWPVSNSGCDSCNIFMVKVGYAEPPTAIQPTTESPLFCVGENTTVNIDLANVSNLYGYQLKVNYDPSLVSATGAFDNSFFDVNGNGSVPPLWDGTCTAGLCPFAKSELDPDPTVDGSGTVAKVTFTGLQAGEFDVTITEDILSDRDAMPIGHAIGTLHLTVCGFAKASGVVSLQGRATPIDAGTVTLTDGVFGPYSTNFDPSTGAWSISNIKVMPGGTSYTFDAAHGLYLGNQLIHTLNPGDAYAAATTKLKGGDADNTGLIDVSDLSCIGGAFGGAPVVCGTTGSSDINADLTTNILDLVLPGGNYGLSTPQAW